MNWRNLIWFSSLTNQQKWFLRMGTCPSMSIDDKKREVKLIVRLEPAQYKEFKDKELETTSIGFFKKGKELKASMCRLFINVEEEK